MSRSFWQKLERPIKVLAPMAGYTDAAFRLLCREFGADVVMTELISADAIAYAKFRVQKSEIKIGNETFIFNKVEGKNHNTAEMLSFFDAERPLVIQLFGKYPEKFAKAARWLTDELGPDGIDINMGCPARKVVGSDHGAALLRNHTLAQEIVSAVKENTDLPVSVKTRLGWSDDDEILEFGPKLVAAGAEAITLHGRTYKDGFKGEARWENIFRLKEMLGDKAVVIGNGDIKDNSQFSVLSSQLNENCKFLPAGRHGKIENCPDGFAIGRAAFGKPWIFSQNTDNGIQKAELKKLILRHAQLAFEAKGEKGIIEFRKHVLCYLKGFPNAKELRSKAVSIKTIDDIEAIIDLL